MIRQYLSRDFFGRGEQIMADLYVEHREVSMHTHEFWELSYIYSGKGKHHFCDKSIDIREGLLFLFQRVRPIV